MSSLNEQKDLITSQIFDKQNLSNDLKEGCEKQDKLHRKITSMQLICMNNKAISILPDVKDFIINRESFKDLKICYAYLHFHFIEKNAKYESPANPTGELYYIIINSNLPNLENLSQTAYKAYQVNDNGFINDLNLGGDDFNNFKERFKNGIGELIKTRSNITKITEYITFTKVAVENFRASMSNTDNMVVKLICIDKNCVEDGQNDEVNEYLRCSENQNRMSLAFQQINVTPTDDFYDIGNMQP